MLSVEELLEEFESPFVDVALDTQGGVPERGAGRVGLGVEPAIEAAGQERAYL